MTAAVASISDQDRVVGRTGQTTARLPLLLTAIFLVGLPGLFGWFLLDHLAENDRYERYQRAENDLLEILARVATLGNLPRRFGNLFDRLTLQSWTLPKIAGYLSRLRRENPDVLDVYLFDHAGKRVSVPGSPTRLVFASQQFLQALLRPEFVASTKMLQAFAGNDGAITLMRASPGTIVDLQNGERLTWGGWFALKNENDRVIGYVLIFLHKQAITAEDLLNKAVIETNRLTDGNYLVGWQDPLTPTILHPHECRFPVSLADHLANLPPWESISRWQDQVVAVYITEAGERLFGHSLRLSSAADELSSKRAYYLVVLVLSCLVLYQSLVRAQSLRAKIIWLFAIAGGFPLVVFLSTSILDRQDRENLLERNTREDHLEYLTKFDAGARAEFLPALRAYSRFSQAVETLDVAPIRENAASAVVSSTKDGDRCLAAIRTSAATVAAMETLRDTIQGQRGLITRCILVDRDGHTRFFHGYDTARPGGIRQVEGQETLPEFALNILQIVNQEQSASGTAAAGNVLASLAVASKIVPDWLEEEEILKEHQIGQNRLLAYYRLFPRDGSCKRALFLATHDSRLAQIKFLRRYLGGRSRWRKNAARLYALPVVSGGRWPAFIEDSVARDPLLRKMRDLVLTAGLPQHATVWLNNRKFLVSALRGNYLDGYVLLLARPYSSMAGQTRRISSRGAAIAFVVLFFVLAIAWSTARGLLDPVQQLTQGVIALKQRNFNHRVSSGKIAELATVAQRFNVILGDLKDLELARSVQETLWPAEGLAGNGWSVQGRCQTASELGGDYYDWFLRADGCLVLAIGDVAGHGIPSALVAASAKMELAMNAENEADPAKILAEMNAGLLMQAGRKRPMSFWLGIFHPAQQVLWYANAGQNYPLLLEYGQQPKMLQGGGYPLGSRRKAQFTSEKLRVSENQRLVIYSDGIVEARTSSDQQFGYERLEGLANDLFHRQVSAADTVSAIFLAAQNWAGRAIPEDDQTLVLLDLGTVPTPGNGRRA